MMMSRFLVVYVPFAMIFFHREKTHSTYLHLTTRKDIYDQNFYVLKIRLNLFETWNPVLKFENVILNLNFFNSIWIFFHSSLSPDKLEFCMVLGDYSASLGKQTNKQCFASKYFAYDIQDIQDNWPIFKCRCPLF